MDAMLETYVDIIEIAFFLMFYSIIHGWAMEIGAKRLEKQRTTMTKKSSFLTRRVFLSLILLTTQGKRFFLLSLLLLFHSSTLRIQ